jgi:hypothetical protein
LKRACLVDGSLAALLFAAAAVVGSAYIRVFDTTGVRVRVNPHTLSARSMWYGQSDFAAAVALACGLGYVNIPDTSTAALAPFLNASADRVSCAELPAGSPSHNLNITQRLYRYLMWATAAVWKIRGVSWSGLWPLFGLLYGATTAACYGLFRLGMGRALACAASLAMTISALHLGNLPGLRDYAKAPFILCLILIAAQLAKRVDRRRFMFGFSAAFGAVLGIGFGFRNDVLIVVPFLPLALLAWDLPRDARAIRARLAAMAIASVTFAMTAWPILSDYARGSNSGHVALLGLTPGFAEPLGISGSVYEWAHVFRDAFADTLINSYTYRVHGHPVAYFSGDYDRAMIDYLLLVARHWPADVLARAYAAVLKIVDLPFSVGIYGDPIPFGIRNPTVLHLYNLQIRVLQVFEGAGLVAVVLALATVSRLSIGRALLLLVSLIYLAGYPAIQFQPRHFFHLEFVAWLAVGFLAERLILFGSHRIRAWRFGDRTPTPRGTVRPVAVFAAIAVGLVMLPLAGARLYQQRHMRAFLKTYVDAPREPLSVQAVEAGQRTLLRAPMLWDRRHPERRVNTEYIVAVFSPAVCPAARLPVTFRYDTPDEWHDYSLEVILQLARDDPPTEVFFPAYHVAGSSRFDGIEVPRGFESCVPVVDRLTDLRRMPMLPVLTLTPHWDRRPLYQKLAGWETSAPAPLRPVYALPRSLAVARATLDEVAAPVPVLWRTPIVYGDVSQQWRITGTPPGPRWPVLQFAAQTRTPHDRFVLEGEIVRGGVTLGLVRGETFADGDSLTVSTSGRFAVVLAPHAAGPYGVLLLNAVDDSWLLRHAPSIATLFGWFRNFNDVRITRAGWVPRTVD